MAHLCQGLQQNKHTTTVVNNHSSTEYTLLLLWSEYALLLLPYLNVINLPTTHQTYLLSFTQVTANPHIELTYLLTYTAGSAVIRFRSWEFIISQPKDTSNSTHNVRYLNSRGQNATGIRGSSSFSYSHFSLSHFWD
jgi:hypothetical protein